MVDATGNRKLPCRRPVRTWFVELAKTQNRNFSFINYKKNIYFPVDQIRLFARKHRTRRGIIVRYYLPTRAPTVLWAVRTSCATASSWPDAIAAVGRTTYAHDGALLLYSSPADGNTRAQYYLYDNTKRHLHNASCFPVKVAESPTPALVRGRTRGELSPCTHSIPADTYARCKHNNIMYRHADNIVFYAVRDGKKTCRRAKAYCAQNRPYKAVRASVRKIKKRTVRLRKVEDIFAPLMGTVFVVVWLPGKRTGHEGWEAVLYSVSVHHAQIFKFYTQDIKK